MKCLFPFLFLFSLLLSCSGEEAPIENVPTKSNAKAITSFSIEGNTASINEPAKTITLEVLSTDLTALTPSITTSPKSTVNPTSGTAQDFSNTITYTVTAEDGSKAEYKVSITSGIVGFTFNQTKYEIIKQNMTWTDAAAYAVSRGGMLAEINDAAEQDAIFAELQKASIINSRTVAPDGGGASYVWIGGNDIAEEGKWIWDGDNDSMGIAFWMGKQDGKPIDALYNNWGNEPDDFGRGQDALGLALTDWPLGKKGQWNDVSHDNKLYFVIEM